MLHAALVAGRFNLQLLAAIGMLGLSLAAALKPTPPDRRKTKLLTPAQKQRTKDAAGRIVKALEAVQPAARALRRQEDARALGRTSDVGESPDSIHDAIKTFLTAAPGLLDLLDDAEVDAAYREALARDESDLTAIADSKEDRKLERTAATQAILEDSLAVEIGLQFFRGRVNSRLQTPPPSLGYMPRKAERRKSPVTTSDDGDEKSGEGGEQAAEDEEKADAGGKPPVEQTASSAAGTDEPATTRAAEVGEPAAKDEAPAKTEGKKDEP